MWKKLNSDKTDSVTKPKFWQPKLWQNPNSVNTQVVTRLKLLQNSNYDKTQIVTLKLWQSSNCDKTQWGKNSNCDKNQNVTLKLWQNSNCDKPWIEQDVGQNLKCDNTQITSKLKTWRRKLN